MHGYHVASFAQNSRTADGFAVIMIWSRFRDKWIKKVDVGCHRTHVAGYLAGDSPESQESYGKGRRTPQRETCGIFGPPSITLRVIRA